MTAVAIFGCGPSGLAAAKAALDVGASVQIYSRTLEPSKLFGCQYLHAPVPGYEDVPSVQVSYKLVGTAEQYRKKVYGDKWEGKVSPEDFIGEHQAWDIRETYARMYEQILTDPFVRCIDDVIDPAYIRTMGTEYYKMVISTIPAVWLCENKHDFQHHEIYAEGDSRPSTFEDNSIVCNGTPGVEWYRSARVFGYRTIEYPEAPSFALDGGARVNKPLSTNCDCFPEIRRVGRYGEWDKKVLVSDVYPKVSEWMNEL